MFEKCFWFKPTSFQVYDGIDTTSVIAILSVDVMH